MVEFDWYWAKFWSNILLYNPVLYISDMHEWIAQWIKIIHYMNLSEIVSGMRWWRFHYNCLIGSFMHCISILICGALFSFLNSRFHASLIIQKSKQAKKDSNWLCFLIVVLLYDANLNIGLLELNRYYFFRNCKF